MKKIKGQNLRVFVSQVCVIEATSCSITYGTNMEDISTKDTENDFSDQGITARNWQVSVDSLSENNILSMAAIILAQNPVDVEFDITEGAMNREHTDAAVACKGKALLTDFQFTAQNRQFVNITAQFQGTGALSGL